MEYVIIIGERASGKTINRVGLMEKFECTECFDCPGEHRRIQRSKAERILILTCDPDVKDPCHKGKNKPRMEGLRVTVADAAVLLGDRWIAPVSQFPCMGRVDAEAQGRAGAEGDDKPVKLVQITALVCYSVVIAADTEEQALKFVKTWEHAWDANADLIGVSDVEVDEVRYGTADDAHFVLKRKCEVKNEDD